MRTLTLLVFFGCSTLWSQAQAPPKGPPVPKQESAKGAASEENSTGRQQPAKEKPAPTKDQIETSSKETTSAAETKEELETNRKLADYTRQLAAFTRYLVVVGALQFCALIGQGVVFWFTLRENRKLIGAAGTAADAARNGALAAVESNNLTRESIEEARRSNVVHEELVKESNALTRDSHASTQQANELTRRSFLLANRAKLIVRSVVVADIDRLINYREIPGGPGTEPLRGSVLTVNLGNTAARLVEEFNSVLFIDAHKPFTAWDSRFGGKPVHGIKLPPGLNTRAIDFATDGGEPLSLETIEDLHYGTLELYIWGWIGYRDESDSYRQVGYCRKWDRGLARFVTTGDPDYEYSD